MTELAEWRVLACTYIIGKLSPPDVNDPEVYATSTPLPILIVR